MKGTLYVVSTPIGNLEDITLRALRTLKEVDLVAAEDTRRSGQLLRHFGIDKPLISYWSERERSRTEEIARRINAGESVALISDAGTPGISDPGGVLIARAIEEGIPVVPVPGPSAFVAALSVSGLPTDEFTFVGFLPAKSGERKKRLSGLALEARTLVFYEAPHRIIETVDDMAEIFGDRRAAVVKEITKLHETVIRSGLGDMAERLEQTVVAGEYVLIVEGMSGRTGSLEEALEEVAALMKKGKGRKEAVSLIAGQYGVSKKDLYDRSLGK